jgi:hypothetical protein
MNNNILNQYGYGRFGKLDIMSSIRKKISSGFLIVIVICTITYLALLISKSKYDKKYIVALLVMFIFVFIGSVFPTTSSPQLLIAKVILLIAPLITILIINILIGQNKF